MIEKPLEPRKWLECPQNLKKKNTKLPLEPIEWPKDPWNLKKRTKIPP